MSIFGKFISFVFCCVLFSAPLISQTVKIQLDLRSIGFIYNDGIISGTGFVFLKENQILTCAHVIDTTKIISFRSDNKIVFLKVVKYDALHDLALLKADEIISPGFFNVDTTYHVYAKQPLVYVGFNPRTYPENRVLQYNAGWVRSLGDTASGKFIEFDGVAIGGYSGGPVINTNGLIVGIIREGNIPRGTKEGARGGNWAYSVLYILE